MEESVNVTVNRTPMEKPVNMGPWQKKVQELFMVAGAAGHPGASVEEPQEEESGTGFVTIQHPVEEERNCIGDSIESQKCEEDELEHLRTVEPHCFDINILPTEFCPPPPTLWNGYVLDDDNSYFAGKRIVYTCNSGYTLVGEAVAECKEDLSWQVNAMKCQRLLCSLPQLPSGITVAPEKDSYQVGDKIK
ncbi:unnamed protein product, partial [Staurois parvus]